MKVAEFCGNVEYTILQFIFSFTDDVREKIVEKKLFYKEQIVRYVQKQIDLFFGTFHFKGALLQVYKNEAYRTIMFKINNTLKEHNIFQCI